MFAKNKISQSMIDAVNKIMSEKEVESKEEFLSEGWDEMLKSVKDKNKPQPSGGAGKKQGSRYGGSKQKEEPEEKEVKEELKGNQHKIDKNKNNKIDAEDFKMLRKEELKGNQSKIDANHNGKIDGQDFKILRGKKKVAEDTFAGKLLNSLAESEEIQKEINEVMKKDATASDWINDFLHTDNPKFDGKSKAERKNMALAAYYSMKKRSRKRNESIEVELDESAPKKMDDVAKQNLEPAKKGVVDTVKSDFKNFKSFLAGKKETNEAISSNKQTIDTLAGRSKKVPKEAKIDNDHSSAKVELKSEEVEQLDEDRWLMKYLLSRGINPQFVSRNQKVAHAKSNEFKKYRRDHQQMQGEEVQSEATSPIFRPKATDYNNPTKARARRNTGLPFAGPYAKTSADPMQRARSMAQSAMQSIKDKQNQPTTMDKVKSAVDKTKKVATKTFMTAFKP